MAGRNRPSSLGGKSMGLQVEVRREYSFGASASCHVGVSIKGGHQNRPNTL